MVYHFPSRSLGIQVPLPGLRNHGTDRQTVSLSPEVCDTTAQFPAVCKLQARRTLLCPFCNIKKMNHESQNPTNSLHIDSRSADICGSVILPGCEDRQGTNLSIGRNVRPQNPQNSQLPRLLWQASCLLRARQGREIPGENHLGTW